MAQLNNYIASARSLSFVVIILILTCLYVTISNYKERKDFNNARNLFAYWILCNELQSSYDEFKGSKKPKKFELPQSWEKGHDHYYMGLGKIIIRQIDSLYEVKLVQPDPAEDVFQKVPDIQPWVTIVGSDATKEIFKISPEIAHDNSQGGIIFLEAFNKQFPEEGNKFNKISLDPVRSILEYEKHTTLLDFNEYLNAYDFKFAVAKNPIIQYKKFERKVYSSTIQVPVINLKLYSSYALLMIALCVFVLLVTIRSRLDVISSFRTSSFEEPWLLLDAYSRFPIMLSIIWQSMIITAPTIIFICHIIIIKGMLAGGDIFDSIFAIQIGVSFFLTCLSFINGIYSIKAIVSISEEWRQKLNQNRANNANSADAKSKYPKRGSDHSKRCNLSKLR